MFNHAKYDEIFDFYAKFAEDATNLNSLFGLATQTLFEMIQPVTKMTICDLACGEGHLSRQLMESGAIVTGIDISENLLKLAEVKNEQQAITFILDNAQQLTKLPHQHFDAVVCNLALMDIPDLVAVYKNVFNILKAGGDFIFSITHPCFQSPQTSILTDDEGQFMARRIVYYATEGLWHSEGTGLRAKVGAYHRTFSTYVNELIQCDFTLLQIKEPLLPQGGYVEARQQGQVEIPSLMIIKARK